MLARARLMFFSAARITSTPREHTMYGARDHVIANGEPSTITEAEGIIREMLEVSDAWLTYTMGRLAEGECLSFYVDHEDVYAAQQGDQVFWL